MGLSGATLEGFRKGLYDIMTMMAMDASCVTVVCVGF